MKAGEGWAGLGLHGGDLVARTLLQAEDCDGMKERRRNAANAALCKGAAPGI